MKGYDAIKTLVSIPAWAEALNQGQSGAQIKDGASAYSLLPIVYYAHNLRIDALSSVPLYIDEELDGDFPLDIFYPQNKRIGLKQLIALTESAMLLRGGALWVNQVTGRGISKGIQFINPFTVKVEWDKEKRARRFWQEMDGKHYPEKGYWYEGEDAVFFRAHNPTDDIGFGIGAAEIALTDAKATRSMVLLFNAFFEGGALPTTILPIPQGTPSEDIKRIEDFFRRGIGIGQGIMRRVLGMRVNGDGNNWKPFTFTPNFADMDITAIRDVAVENIAWAFGMSTTLLKSNAASNDTAGDDYKSFISKTISARCNYYEEEISNAFPDIDIEFAVEEMTEMQADESTRASAVAAYTSAIQQSPEAFAIAAAILGTDIPEGAQAMLDALTAEKERRAQEQAAQLAQMQQQQSAPMQPKTDNEPPTMQEDDAEKKSIERAQFKRYAAKHGGNAVKIAAFRFEHLDADEQAALKRLGGRALKDVGADYDALRSDYERQIAELLLAYLAAQITEADFDAKATALIRPAIAKAYQYGKLSQGGIMDLSDQAAIDAQVQKEIANLKQAGLGGLTRDGVDARAELYANTLDATFALGALAVLNDDILTFVGEDGFESCVTCQQLKGQSHAASWWKDNGLVPEIGNTNLECGGWRCQHYLQDALGRAVTLP